MQVSDLSSYVLHESQFGYRQNVMLKETLCVFVLIRQVSFSLTFSLNTAWKMLANAPVIFLFLLLPKHSQPHITQKFPGMFIIEFLCLLGKT